MQAVTGGELQLTVPRSGRRPFQQGSSDEFDVVVPQLLGGLKLLRVGHDNSGSAPGWGLESVQVFDIDTLEMWLFQVASFIECVRARNSQNTALLCVTRHCAGIRSLLSTLKCW